MEHDELVRTLAGIRAEIEGVEFRDPATRERLEALLAGIEQHSGEAKPVAPLVSNFTDSVRQLEAEHPDLTAGLGQWISMLSTMGI